MSKNLTIGIIAIIILLGAYGAFAMMANQSEEQANQVIEQTTDNQADDQASALEGGRYMVTTTESTMNWKGSKTLIENYVDVGTIGLKEGSLSVLDGNITGSFTIDMATIAATATGGGSGQELLTNHLKSDDFFDVTNFPTAEFVITSATPSTDVATSHQYTVTGDLTIKGKTNEISFPAHIYMKDGKLHAEASTDVDRTKFDVRFGSDSFFDNLGDNVIDDMFTVAFHLIANYEGPVQTM